MHTYSNTAIVLGDLKDALLHFEHVIPMNLTGEFMGLRLSGQNVDKFSEPSMGAYHDLSALSEQPELLMSLYPPRLRNAPRFREIVNIFDGMLFSLMVRNAYGSAAHQKYLTELARVVNADGPASAALGNPSIQSLKELFD